MRYRLLRTCALFALLSPASVYAERRYAVIIGNDEGRRDDRALKYAERDAERFAGVLRKLGSVSPQDAVVLLGESATAIRQAVLDVNARIRAEDEYESGNSTLIVYYSGHADAEGLHPGDSTLPYQEMRAMVAGSAAKVRVLILDACRSGGLTNVKGGGPAKEFDIAIEEGPGIEGLVLMSSSAATEDSHESERLGASFFSHHLTNALLGAGDKNADGKITLHEAYGYAYNQTLRASGKTAALQHPTYAYEVKGRGELVITKLEGDRQKTGTLAFSNAGTYLVLHEGEGGDVLAELIVEDRGMRFAVPPARYVVQERGRDNYREYQVEVRAGSVAELATIEPRTVAYARLVRKGADVRSSSHGAYVMGGGRGPILSRLGSAPALSLAYAIDLEWASFQVRGRVSRVSAHAGFGELDIAHSELALGLVAQRYFDLPWFSVGLGLLVEGVYHHQSFFTSGIAPARSAFGGAFGGMVTLEREIDGPAVFRVQGGPITYVLPYHDATEGPKLATPLTGFLEAGFGWRF